MKLREITCAVTLTFCLCATLALADVPGTINFQGNLTDSSGAPETGIFSMQFLIYADSTGGSSLWSEIHSSVEVTSGLFRVFLGSVTSFPDTLFDGSVRWLETEVESETLSPREKLVTVPYGFKSKTAGTAAWADSAGHALWADTASTALWAGNITRVDTADYALTADSALHAVYSDTADYALQADSANHAATSDTAVYATSAPPDDDWTTSGDSLYHLSGNVAIGTSSATDLLTIASANGSGITIKSDPGSTSPFITFNNPDNDYPTVISNQDGKAFDVEYPTNTYLLTVDTSGYVGIGTLYPNAKLEIVGTNEAIRASATGYPDRFVQMGYHSSIGPLVQGNTYPRLTLDADEGAAGMLVLGRGGDKVGIGTIDPISNLDVAGKMALGLTYAGNLTGPDNSLIVEGSIGIGTNNPVEELDVTGTARVDGFKMPTSAGSGKVLTSDASGVGTWQTATSNVGGQGIANYLTKFTDTTTVGNSIIYQNGDSIGIGTNVPAAKLDVNGSVKLAGFQMLAGAGNGKVLTSDASGVASWANTVGGSGTSGFIPKFTTNLTLDNSEIFQSGTNIRIGGSLSTHKLTITNSSADDVLRLSGPDAYGAGARLNFGDMDRVYIEEDEDDKLTIYSMYRTAIMGANVGIGTLTAMNNMDVEGRMAVGANYSGTSYAPTNGMIVEGNVGIGTITPGYKLHVNGTFYANTVNTGPGATEVQLMNQNVRTADAVTFATVNTGQGANELYDMNQNVTSGSNVSFATVNTGYGANELRAMNQNVRTTDAVTFATVNTGHGANELYDMNQHVMTSSAVTFATVNTGPGANELYAMNQNVRSSDDVDFNQLSVGTTFSTHKAVIANTAADDVLRLLGPDGGGLYYGARLNFGDSDYVYLDEDTDDHLVIHGGGGIMLNGGYVSVDLMSGTTGGNLVRWYNDRLYYDSSSRRYKEDIQPLEDNFEKILDVEPKSFIDKASGERNIGFIAEELADLGLGNLVIERDGRPDAIKYQLISVYLLEMIKELNTQNQALTSENTNMHSEFQQLQDRITALEAAIR